MHKIRVAVTGAAGQIGSVIVKQLGELPNVEPVAICRNTISAGIVHSVNPKCDIRIGSITEGESARNVLRDCNIAINCALAMVSGRPKLSRSLNMKIVENLCGIDKLNMFIHLSSIAVYGSCFINKKISKNLFEKPHATSDYGRSKLFIENFIDKICRSRKLKNYTLRVGHVIGAKMDRSREIFGFVEDPEFRLPYDGNLPSNTVHVDRLAAMVSALLLEPVPNGTYNVIDENMIWREVFNWHTETIGIKAVQGMSIDCSDRLRNIYSSPSIIGDVQKWFSSVPFSSIIKNPAIFEFAYRLLASTPQYFTNRIAAKYKRIEIGRQLAELSKNSDSKLGPVYFSDLMPGKNLIIPEEVIKTCPTKSELDKALIEWYARLSKPRWLLDHFSNA